MAISRILTVDAGATASRARLHETDGTVLAAAEGPAANAWWGIPKTVAAVRELWRSVAVTTGVDPDRPDGVTLVAAIAGTEHPETQAEIRAGLQDFPQVQIISDGYAALLGAADGQSAALVITGTGTIAHRLHADGTCTTLGGWGAVAGDQGGGAWTGLAALRQWLLWRDGLLPEFDESSLVAGITDAVGATRPEVYLWLAKARPADYARLAPIVWQAADDGDRHAVAICADAVMAVRRLVSAIAGDPPECDVYIAGGLAARLRPALQRDHGVEVLVPRSDANHGAFMLGVGSAPAEQPRELPPGTNHAGSAVPVSGEG